MDLSSEPVALREAKENVMVLDLYRAKSGSPARFKHIFHNHMTFRIQLSLIAGSTSPFLGI
jgi:hypothetical protein